MSTYISKLLLLLQVFSFVSSNSICFSSQERKLFYYAGSRRELFILTSNSVESKLVASVFQIFAAEVLGYHVEIDTQEEAFALFDKDARFKKLSVCDNPLCNQFNPTLVPRSMIALDVVVSPSYHVDTWGLLDAGQLGPAIRLAWLVPNNTMVHSNLHRNHWKLLRDKYKAQTFRPSEEKMRFIRKFLKASNMSIFSPPSCMEDDSWCGVLITKYLEPDSPVVQQILHLKLHVQVIPVGSSLSKVVSYLESFNQSDKSSYMVLHYTPSVISLRHSLVPLMFPECRDPLLQRDEMDMNCLYTANRMAKVVWAPVQDESPNLYKLIQHFSFTYKEYLDLLETYNADNESTRYHDVACRWLSKVEFESKTIFEVKAAEFPLHAKPELYIGGIFPMTGAKYRAPELARVAQMAVEDVNKNQEVLSSHKLVMSINDGMCEADVVMKRFIDIIKTKDTSRFRSTVGMLGPACSDTVEPIAGVSKHFRTVVISYSAEGSISSENSPKYPFFFRTIAENKEYKHAYIATLRKLGWNKVAALTQDGAKYSDYMSALQDEFQNNNIEFVINRKFPKEATDLSMYIKDLKDRGAKIIIGEFYPSSARLVICEAYRAEMTQKQGYVWFLPGWYDDKWYDIDALKKIENRTQSNDSLFEHSTSFDQGTIQMFEDTEVGVLPSCSTREMLSALNGHLSLIHANFAPNNNLIPTNSTVAEWKNTLKLKLLETRRMYKTARSRMTESNIEIEPADIDFDINQQIKINKYSGYVYDAVWLYAKALDTLLKDNETASYIQNLHSEKTVRELVKIIRNTDFEGVTGRINFQSRPSRLSNVRIIQWLKNTSKEIFEQDIGLYVPNYEETANRNHTDQRMEIWRHRKIRWQTLDGSKPLDNPKECGILSAFATKLNIECQLAITVVFMISFGIVLLCLFIVFLILNRRYKLKMKATEDRMRALGLLTPISALALDEWEIPRDRVVINRKLGEGAFGTVYGGESFFDEKGWVPVAVKTLKLGSSIDEKIDFLSEAEMMKRFDHKNIVKLLGVCTRNEPVYTVMEFMLYGDLKTYLLARRHLVGERNREELDEVSNRRLTSMAFDVSKGLEYLAELKYVHRDIACRNCLVNSSRTVKLADFGMTRPMFESDYYRFSKKGMLPVRWMSPESLTDGIFSPMSDIWSFGVLLYEMITFGSFPFQGMSNNQVLVYIKNGNTLSPPQGIKPKICQLLRGCWSHEPSKRPTAAEVVDLLFTNPRLISPSIDIPLASVQMEIPDSPELLAKHRKPSFSLAQKSRPHQNIMKTSESKSDDGGYSSGTYSPMQGISHPLFDNNRTTEEKRKDCSLKEESVDFLNNCSLGPSGSDKNSYIPAGYIVLDHSEKSTDYQKYDARSATSV